MSDLVYKTSALEKLAEAILENRVHLSPFSTLDTATVGAITGPVYRVGYSIVVQPRT